MSATDACVGLVLFYLAWALVALSQPWHWESVRWLAGRGAPKTSVMRSAAIGLAALAAGWCVRLDGWSFGLLLWICQACAAAVLVTLTLACLHPRDGFAAPKSGKRAR